MMAAFKEWQPHYESQFNANFEQKTFRLALNHSQLAAAVKMLELVTDIDADMVEEAIDVIEKMSVDREKAISLEHPDVQQFFEVVEFLESKGLHVNHENDGIAVNINEIYLMASTHGQPLQTPVTMKSLLKSSNRFVENKVISSKAINKKVRCWIFNEAA